MSRSSDEVRLIEEAVKGFDEEARRNGDLQAENIRLQGIVSDLKKALTLSDEMAMRESLRVKQLEEEKRQYLLNGNIQHLMRENERLGSLASSLETDLDLSRELVAKLQRENQSLRVRDEEFARVERQAVYAEENLSATRARVRVLEEENKRLLTSGSEEVIVLSDRLRTLNIEAERLRSHVQDMEDAMRKQDSLIRLLETRNSEKTKIIAQQGLSSPTKPSVGSFSSPLSNGHIPSTFIPSSPTSPSKRPTLLSLSSPSSSSLSVPIARHEALIREYERVSSQLLQAQKELVVLERSHPELVPARQFYEVRAKAETMEVEVDALRRDKEYLRQEYNRVESEKERLNSQVDSLVKQLAEAQASIASSSAEINSLHSLSAAQRERITSLEQSATELAAELNRVKSKKDKYHLRCRDVEKQLREQQRLHDEHMRDKDVQISSILEEKERTYQESVGMKQRDFDRNAGELELKANERVKMYAEQSKRLSEEVNGLTQRWKSCEVLLNDRENAVRKLEEDVKVLRKVNGELNNKISADQVLIAKLKNMIVEYDMDRHSDEEKIRQLSATVSAKDSEVQRAVRMIDEIAEPSLRFLKLSSALNGSNGSRSPHK